MGDLANKFIDASYGSLLKTTEDTGLSGTTKTTIQDGNGVDTALKLSTENVDVNGDLQTSGTTRVQGDGTLINVSGDISQFTNDSGYLDSLPTNVMVEGENNSLLTNDSGYLTSGTIPSNVMKEGENVSLLTNDAGYLSSIPTNVMVEGENNSLLNNDSGYISSIPNTYLESGDNVSELVNDSGYLTSIPTNVMVEGEDVSLLNNDSGYITGVNDGTLQVSGGGAVPTTKFGITDNLNNETGLNIEKGTGTLGFDNDVALTSNAALIFKNNAWNIVNFPFGAAGTSGLVFQDANGATSYQFTQNRFGGVNYFTAGDSQPHIFGGNGTPRIDIGNFGNPNNSNNWYQGYLDNITQVNLSGTDLEIIKRDGSIVVDTTDLSPLLGVETIVAGTNVTVDNTDPNNPIVNASGGGGGGVSLHPVVSGGYYGNQWNYSPNMTVAAGYGQRILIRPVFLRAGQYDTIHAWYQTASSQAGSFNRYAVYMASGSSHITVGDTNMPQPTTKLIDISIPATNSGGQNVGLASSLSIPTDGVYMEAYIYDNGVDNTMSGGFSSLTNTIPYNNMFGRDLPFKSPFAGSGSSGTTHAISNGVVYTSFPTDLSTQISWNNTSIAPGFNWSII